MPDQMFWELTLPLFLALWERHKARERRADRRAGEVAVATYNVNRDLDERPEPYTWVDVFTEYKEPEKPMTDEEMLAVMEMIFRVHSKE